MAYILRIPFKPAPQKRFRLGSFSILGLEAELVFAHPFHVLMVRGLDSAEEGERLLARLGPALVWPWVGFQSFSGIEVSQDLQELKILDEPGELQGFGGIRAHAVGDEGRPAIYPDDKKISFVQAGAIEVRAEDSLEVFVERLESGLGAHIDEALSDPRKQLAL